MRRQRERVFICRVMENMKMVWFLFGSVINTVDIAKDNILCPLHRLARKSSLLYVLHTPYCVLLVLMSLIQVKNERSKMNNDRIS